mgnify:CR=1 FL=1
MVALLLRYGTILSVAVTALLLRPVWLLWSGMLLVVSALVLQFLIKDAQGFRS